MNDAMTKPSDSLAELAGISPALHKEALRAEDHAWIEVIQRMDSTYAELVESQVELEEKNAELENAQGFIDSVLSSISDILIVCDINGRIQQVNKALIEIVEKSSQEIVDEPLSILFGDEHQDKVAEFPERIRSGCLADLEIDLVSRNAEHFPMAVNCNARFDHNNRLCGFVVTGRPLGELRKAYAELHSAHEKLITTQQQLIQSEKMASLGRLVAGVAHELNNPISFLYANMHAMKRYEKTFIAYLDAVHRDIDPAERNTLRSSLNIDHLMKDISPLVDGSLEGAERVAEIVKNLRQFAMPQKCEKRHFDLIEVIERAISWVVNAAPFKPKIISDFPETFELSNSEGHIHQILINLIQNAIDAMEGTTHPTLHILVAREADQIDIRVRDNGSGIAEQDRVKIFDPFYTTKAVGTGTGLGLYISYGLATEHCHGDLSVSAAEDGGAEFTLRLPLGTDNE